MGQRATGTFSVTIEPLSSEDEHLGRMLVLKTFEGDLVGTGRAQMMSVRTPVDGSAGYVAIDLITGTLHGRRGSFALQHNGIMDRGQPSLSVVVIPDSGTDDLTGLRGTFDIQIENGQHRYVLEYSLGEQADA